MKSCVRIQKELKTPAVMFLELFFAIAFYYIVYRETSPMISIQEHLRQFLQTVSPSKMLPITLITLCLDALFGHFKRCAYKPSPRCQSKSYIAPPKGVLAIRCIFSLVDMITNTKFSNCPNVFKAAVVQQYNMNKKQQNTFQGDSPFTIP